MHDLDCLKESRSKILQLDWLPLDNRIDEIMEDSKVAKDLVERNGDHFLLGEKVELKGVELSSGVALLLTHGVKFHEIHVIFIELFELIVPVSWPLNILSREFRHLNLVCLCRIVKQFPQWKNSVLGIIL